MRYIEKNDNVTREYEVVIDEKELANVIQELNEKCCRALKVVVNVRAKEDRALENFNSIGKNDVDIVRKVYDQGAVEKDKKYFYECEYYRLQIPYVSYLLAAALSSYHSDVDLSFVLDRLIECQKSDELKTYQERMAENGITKELYDEYEHNKDFDFNLFRELYQRAMSCFRLILKSKTFYYNTEENVKKLGGKS